MSSSTTGWSRPRCWRWRGATPSASCRQAARPTTACRRQEINDRLVRAGARRQERGAAEGRRSASCSAAAARRSRRWCAPASPSRSCPASPRRWAARASAGIPLTHRDHAQACVFVTGHLKDGDGRRSTGRCWRGRARPSSSTWAPRPCRSSPRQLIAAWPAAATPVALIENGTTEQRAASRRHAWRPSSGRRGAPDLRGRRSAWWVKWSA